MTSAKRVAAKCGPSGRLRNLDDALRRKEVISRSARASTSSVPHTAAVATRISIRRRDGCVVTVCPAENTGSNSRRNGPAGYANCLGSERIGSAWRGVGQNLMLRLIRRSHAPSGDGVDWLFEKNEQSANSHSCGCIRLTVGRRFRLEDERPGVRLQSCCHRCWRC
jgi:hypothetical protein